MSQNEKLLSITADSAADAVVEFFRRYCAASCSYDNKQSIETILPAITLLCQEFFAKVTDSHLSFVFSDYRGPWILHSPEYLVKFVEEILDLQLTGNHITLRTRPSLKAPELSSLDTAVLIKDCPNKLTLHASHRLITFGGYIVWQSSNA